MDVEKLLMEKSKLVEPVLMGYLDSDNDEVKKMLSHTARAGGKRIRPALLLLACEAVGGDQRKVLSAAASVELLHTFTLVHDDIIDEDDERRGQPTVHAVWGKGMGIIVGDTIYSKAFESLVDARKSGIPSGKVLDALTTLSWANSEIHEGQIMDMFFEKRDDVSEGEYMTMVRKKTGVLIETCLKIGAILGNGSEGEVGALSDFGNDIGIAFQIHDDVLDLTGSREEIGKPVGSDIKCGKKSLMMVHALSKADAGTRGRILEVLKAGECTDEQVKDVIGILNETGSIAYAKSVVDELTKSAKSNLEKLKETEARRNLLELADYVIRRRK